VLTVRAPAKLNLTLEVLRKRPDGYHEVRSVLQAISLCDLLHFEESDGIRITSDLKGWSAGESLVSRAVALLREATGCSEGANIKIEKRVPLLSGLGGDSSDAAAALRGLNRLWKLNLTGERLHGLAARLGSDVAFFLHGGTALSEGRGEIVTPLPPLPESWVVLVLPDVPREPGKTAAMYRRLKPSHYTDGKITEKLVRALREGRRISPSRLFNTFENVAFAPRAKPRVYAEHLVKLGAPRVHLAGSGPALFTLLNDKKRAEDLHARCRDQGMETYLVRTLTDGESQDLR